MTKKQKIFLYSWLGISIVAIIIYSVVTPVTNSAATNTQTTDQQTNMKKAIQDLKNGKYDQVGVDLIDDVGLFLNDPPSQLASDTQKEVYLYYYASAKENENSDPNQALYNLDKAKPVDGIITQKDIDDLRGTLQKSAADAQAAAAKANSPEERKKRGVTIGMTRQEVLESAWGKPQSINKTTTSLGTREQWVYGIGNYLYFDENGILTTIQN